ncbi:major facilitator superfamily protein, partial [Aphelenchoides avenae]
GKLEKVRKSDEKIARVAGVKFIEVKRPPSQPSGGIMESLRNRRFMRRLGVLWMMFFTACISSYANDLNSSSLSGNLFVNQIMFGVLITFSKMMLVVIDTCFPNFSRRNLHHYAQSAVCLCFLTLTVLVAYQANPWFILFFNLLGSMSIEFTWDACFLCAVESVPTNVRSRAVASCSLVARIGAIMSPYLVYLNAFWAPCTFLLVASIGFVNLLVSYKWLEETKGVSLDRIGLEDLPEMDAERETATLHEKEAMLPTNKTIS